MKYLIMVSCCPPMHRCGHRPRGATLIEFAVSLPIFISFLIVLLQGAVLCFQALTLSYAAGIGARRASVIAASSPDSRLEMMKDAVLAQAGALGADASDITVRICMLSDPSCATENPGGGNHHIIVTARKPARLFFGLGVISVSGSAFIQNEPY